MRTVGEWLDKTDEICQELASKAERKKKEEIERTQAFFEGYIEACADFHKRMQTEISHNQG